MRGRWHILIGCILLVGPAVVRLGVAPDASREAVGEAVSRPWHANYHHKLGCSEDEAIDHTGRCVHIDVITEEGFMTEP